MIREAATGGAEALKSVGQGVLGGPEVVQLVEKLFVLMQESAQRTAEIQKQKQEDYAGAPQELQADDDDDEDPEDDETQCRMACEDALGSIMEVAPAEFVVCLPQVGQRLQEWLVEDKAIGLFLACDMLKHLKEMSESV